MEAIFLLTVLMTFSAVARGYTGVSWRVSIHTSNLQYADSDAHEWMAIYGEKGWTTAIDLDDPNKDDGERDQVDVHEFTTDDVGRPIKLLLWHDNTGNEPGWHVSEVVLLNKNTGTTYTFNVHRWIAHGSYNGATQIELEVDWWKYIDNLTQNNNDLTQKYNDVTQKYNDVNTRLTKLETSCCESVLVG